MIPPILPNSTLGILGGGQLGRMLALAARRLGYRVHIFAPEKDTPAGQVADTVTQASYDDVEAMRDFARRVDVLTFEFENVDADTARAAEAYTVVRPSPAALTVAQHRTREKTFLAKQGLPVTPFVPVRTVADLHKGLDQLGRPAVLKTAAFGYDGKGQIRIEADADAMALWDRLDRREAILEAWIELDREISVIGARSVDGVTAFFDPFENVHRHHILDTSTVPARVTRELAAQAVEITRTVLETLDYIGLLCIEFFVARDGRLLINEIAPRTHNSGHLTIDACSTSQFEQQVRAVCGLPLGPTDLLQPAAMANLLGDRWSNGEPNWAAALATGNVKLHLYGKADARPGRKMGHLTALAATRDEAFRVVTAARDALGR